MHTIVKCRMVAFHQFTSVKNMYQKYILQLKCSRISFLKLLLGPYMYAFTGCNLRVGKFDVSASNMIIFCINISPSSGKWTVEMHKSFSTCASQYSWTTVIENPSNVKEVWTDMEFKHKRPYLVRMIHLPNY